MAEDLLALADAMAIVAQIRDKAKYLEDESKRLRQQAQELQVRASEKFDAFISFDLLADKIEHSLRARSDTREVE